MIVIENLLRYMCAKHDTDTIDTTQPAHYM